MLYKFVMKSLKKRKIKSKTSIFINKNNLENALNKILG